MSQLLLVDDASALAELFAHAIHAALGHDVAVVVALADVGDRLAQLPALDLAIVDLSFPQEQGTGIRALVEIHTAYPAAKLAIITQGDAWVAEILRDAWELLPVGTVISKSAPLAYQLDAISSVLRTGTAEIDPAIRPLLPTHRSSHRTAANFVHLVHHAGHAKLWRALMSTAEPSYKEISDITGLKLNTVKNYRAQLLPDLKLHGLHEPTLPQMRDFALRCQPFLEPFLETRPSA